MTFFALLNDLFVGSHLYIDLRPDIDPLTDLGDGLSYFRDDDILGLDSDAASSQTYSNPLLSLVSRQDFDSGVYASDHHRGDFSRGDRLPFDFF